MPNGIYDQATGAIRTTVVDGSTRTGLYAADGSWNVVMSPVGVRGLYHPCGALNVVDATNETPSGIYSPEGWYRVSSVRGGNGAMFVTGIPTGNWVTTFSAVANSSNSAGWNGFTLRQYIPASLLSQSGSKFRISLKSAFLVGSSENTKIAAATARHKAAAGDNFDFESAPLTLKYNNSSSFTIINPQLTNTQSEITLDAVDYTFDEAKDFLVSFYFDDVNADTVPVSSSGVVGAIKYEKSGGNDTATADGTGYINAVSNACYLISKIEVFQAL